MATSPAAPRPSTATLGALFASGLAMCALAVYQWFELLTMRAGGVPSCAVNETINCVTVWNSAFASRIHDLLGVPVAGLGLVWGLAATVLAAVMYVRQLKGQDTAGPTAAVKLWALAGALATITLLTASLRAGAVCPTCIGTYVLAGVYAGVALFLVPGGAWPKASLVPGIGWSAVVGGASFLIMLYPGQHTPKSGGTELAVADGGTATSDQLMAYLNNLPEREASMTSLAREEFLKSPTPDVSRFPSRVGMGPADAPVHIVDFTDVLCGHCRTFETIAAELFKAVPKGRLRLEPRYFPLDGQCNREVQRKGTDNIRCLGAKVQICLESHPKFWDVRHLIFENQPTLTEARIMELALTSGVSRDELQRCVDSYETQTKLDADIAFASLYGIDGTPLVILNGRKTLPVASFLLGMAMSSGDPNATYFLKLPPPPEHEGHQH